jgi:hypothetical protein
MTGSTPAHARDMTQRQRDWHASNDPAVLWPGLDRRALQPAADAIGSAVKAILRGEPASLGVSSPVDLRALGVAALLTGTGPLLGHWIESGALEASEEVSRLLAEHLAQGRARVTRVREEIGPALARIVERGVLPAVMKGYHTAHCYFPEPGTRPFGDVDIIVAPEGIAQAEAALRAAGYTPGARYGARYKRDWHPPGAAEIVSFDLWHARNHWKIELHDGVNFDVLLEHDAHLDLNDSLGAASRIAEMPLLVPRQPLLLAMLLTHASTELYASRLLRLIELVFVIRQDRVAGRLDWSALEALLDRSRALRFVYPAMSLVEQLAPGTIDAGVLARARQASTSRARDLDSRVTPTSPLLRDPFALADRLLWASTARETLRALLALVTPPEGASFAESIRVYHARIGKVLALLRARRAAPDSPAARRAP